MIEVDIHNADFRCASYNRRNSNQISIVIKDTRDGSTLEITTFNLPDDKFWNIIECFGDGKTINYATKRYS